MTLKNEQNFMPSPLIFRKANSSVSSAIQTVPVSHRLRSRSASARYTVLRTTSIAVAVRAGSGLQSNTQQSKAKMLSTTMLTSGPPTCWSLACCSIAGHCLAGHWLVGRSVSIKESMRELARCRARLRESNGGIARLTQYELVLARTNYWRILQPMPQRVIVGHLVNDLRAWGAEVP